MRSMRISVLFRSDPFRGTTPEVFEKLLLNHYLTTLVCNKDIELAYPDSLNHPKQRYRTSAQGRLKLAT
jgi:hypothetical protein